MLRGIATGAWQLLSKGGGWALAGVAGALGLETISNRGNGQGGGVTGVGRDVADATVSETSAVQARNAAWDAIGTARAGVTSFFAGTLAAICDALAELTGSETLGRWADNLAGVQTRNERRINDMRETSRAQVGQGLDVTGDPRTVTPNDHGIGRQIAGGVALAGSTLYAGRQILGGSAGRVATEVAEDAATAGVRNPGMLRGLWSGITGSRWGRAAAVVGTVATAALVMSPDSATAGELPEGAPEGAQLITASPEQIAEMPENLISASGQYVVDPTTNSVLPVEAFQAAAQPQSVGEIAYEGVLDIVPFANEARDVLTGQVDRETLEGAVSDAGGVMGAVFAGAAAGAVFGGVGAIPGAIIGGAGFVVGEWAVSSFFNDAADPAPESPAYTQAPVVATYANNFRFGG
ncbi:MAG: hypothetical protein GW903_00915 [Alphaproteobacteria bacterium]|nr:hypothetical protein [Alphaproteobacteria bacterium]NCQ87530.1 hypothetical protein [Alphaproteobacteria bacterium]NCT06398.1 hypothetical protein [Alphaproteobacteria bacterium]